LEAKLQDLGSLQLWVSVYKELVFFRDALLWNLQLQTYFAVETENTGSELTG